MAAPVILQWTAGVRRLKAQAVAEEKLDALFRKYGWQMQLARAGGTLTGRWKQRGAIEIALD